MHKHTGACAPGHCPSPLLPLGLYGAVEANTTAPASALSVPVSRQPSCHAVARSRGRTGRTFSPPSSVSPITPEFELELEFELEFELLRTSAILFVWVLQKQLRCDVSSSFPLIEIKNPPMLRHKGDDSLWRSIGGFLISINSIALETSQRCRHEKSPYYRLCMLVLVVLEVMVSSSTIRDFHQNSFWQHHCDSIRKLYTKPGVHTV